MTAPVAQSLGRKAGSSASSCPRNGPWTACQGQTTSVRLISLPAESVAVLRFTGDRGPGAIAARTKQLLETLRAMGIEPVGEPATVVLQSTWTFPFRRRDEIAIPVDE